MIFNSIIYFVKISQLCSLTTVQRESHAFQWKRRMADFTEREIYRFIKSRNESKNIRCVVKMFILVYIFFFLYWSQ